MQKTTTLFALALFSITALAQNDPQLPQVYINSCAPTTTITKTVCANGCDYDNSQLQQAIDDAQRGTEIVLEAGATYTGNFDLPQKNGSGWIVIRSSQMAQLPQENHRVTPQDEQYMPKIQTNNTVAVFTAPSKSRHYRLMGLNITITPTALGDANQGGNTQSGFVKLGDFYETNPADIAHDFVIDRCYIHGDPKSNNRRGVFVNCNSVAIVNSHISDFHDVGADAQAIAVASSDGPLKVVNNYLEASGENFIIGGIDLLIQNQLTADVEIRGNHFYHPLSWKQDHPSYAGYPWVIKNLFELKFGRRILIEGNIFENNWEHAQSGMAINLKSSNQDGSMTWAVTEHVTIVNNIIRHCNNGITFSECDCYIHPALAMNNIKVANNIFDDIDINTWGTSGSGFFALVIDSVDKITIDHNTILQTGNTISVDGGGTPNFIFTNNIIPLASYGIKGGGTSAGNNTISTFFPGAVFEKNVFPDQYAGSGYPSNNFYPLSFNDVGFVNYNNGNGGDYHLTSNSAYKNAASDGKDPGADIDVVNTATSGVLNGYYETCNLSTGLTTNNIASLSVSIYPNPSNTQAVLKLEGISDLSNYTVTISDVSGKIVATITTIDKNEINLPTLQVEKGIYFISVKHLSEQKACAKWVKY